MRRGLRPKRKKSRLGVDPPIEVEKDRVAPFAISQERFLHSVGQDLLVEPLESQEMVLGAFDGVGNHRAGFHNEGPVTGLSEKKLSGGLAKGSIQKGVRVSIAKTTR